MFNKNVFHAKRFSNNNKRASQSLNPGCTSGAFYKLPKAGDNIDTSQPLNIQWDTSLDCFSSKGVDIYLYAPFTSQAIIHAWGGVDYPSGSFSTPLEGAWWNSSVAPITLHLAFVESNQPIFTSPVSQGPSFTATFNTTDFADKHPVGGSSNTTTTSTTPDSSSGGGVFQVVGNAFKSGGLSKGLIAVAVLIPLIVVAIGVFVYIKFQRSKEAEKRKRWSEAVDKRMSAISTEWKTMPPNSQAEAIRQSIAIMRNSRASMARMSEIYGNDFRPVSISTTDGGSGAAGVGVGMRKGTGVGLRNPAMGPADMASRKSTTSYASANRKSRISFAADTRFSRSSQSLNVPEVPAIPRSSTDKVRPSGETQRGVATRSFHTAISATYPDDFDVMSPTQKGGPTMLGDHDIKPLDYDKDENVLPALSMIQASPTVASFQKPNPLILTRASLDPSNSPITSPPPTVLSPISTQTYVQNGPTAAYTSPVADSPMSPIPPPAATAQNTNPFAGFMRGPTNAMSPDAMLKAYAARSGVPSSPLSPRAGTPTSGSIKSVKGSIKSSLKISSPYPAFDAPATPEPMKEQSSVRMVYNPYAGQPDLRMTTASAYSTETDEDAYGGYGAAQ